MKKRLLISIITSIVLINSISVMSFAANEKLEYFSKGAFMMDGNQNGTFEDTANDIVINTEDLKLINQRYIDGNETVRRKVYDIVPQRDLSSISKVVTTLEDIKRIPTNLFYDAATIGPSTIRNVLIGGQYYPANAHGGQISTSPDQSRSLGQYVDANANNLSAGKAAYANGQLQLGNGKDVNNSYNNGLNSDNSDPNGAFVYTYHKHSTNGENKVTTSSNTYDGPVAKDNNSSSEGCYTTPNYHIHSTSNTTSTSKTNNIGASTSTIQGGCYQIANYHVHSLANTTTTSTTNNPGATTSSTVGGCYTSPVYHVHNGNVNQVGTCYRAHTHTDACYNWVHDCNISCDKKSVYDQGREHNCGRHYHQHGPDAIDWFTDCWECCGHSRYPNAQWVSVCQGLPLNKRTTLKHNDVAEGPICGKSTSTIEYYNVGCGKNGVQNYSVNCNKSGIQFYTPGCGHTHGKLEKIEVDYTKINN